MKNKTNRPNLTFDSGTAWNLDDLGLSRPEKQLLSLLIMLLLRDNAVLGLTTVATCSPSVSWRVAPPAPSAGATNVASERRRGTASCWLLPVTEAHRPEDA
jgi:hypothetical protein